MKSMKPHSPARQPPGPDSAVLHSRDQFSQLHDGLQMIALILDLDGNITYCNDYLLNLTGWERAEVEGRDWFDQFLPEDNRSHLRTLFAVGLDSGKMEPRYESEIVTRAGEHRMIRWNNCLLSNPGGELVGVVCLGADITQARQSRWALEENQARLQAILAAPLDPIITIDVFGIIKTASNSMERVFGWKPSELVGQNINMLMPEPYRSEHDSYLERYRETGRTNIIGRLREFRACRRDGSEFPCEISVDVAEMRGQPPLVVGIIRDITPRKAVEKELERLNAMLSSRNEELEHFAYNSEKLASMGKLAASVAHEIRNPLTAIKMHLFSVQQSLKERPDLDDDFRVVNEEIQRLESVVRNFLDYSRSPNLKLQSVKLEVILDKVLELFGRRLVTKGIQVIREGDKALGPVVADLEQMKQVFINLLTNAEEAMPNGGILAILGSATRDENDRPMNLVRFHDNGPGIPEAVRHRLFEPFFTTKEDGTGLGLAIARRILEGHGGRLSLETTSIGTSFAVWLPPAKTDA